MTDQTEEKTVQQVVISLPSPSEITIDTWLTYQAGVAAYEAEQEKANKPAFQLISRYMGACALYEAGVLHVTGSDELKAALRARRLQGMAPALISLIGTRAFEGINKAFLEPLPTWTLPSSDTG